MSDQTASFKVTLHRRGVSEKEVRRFVLPKSTLSSYSILRDKLQVVFQSIKHQTFEVTWEDKDGDRVVISSDEELMIAMKEMGGDVYRLRIDVGKGCDSDVGDVPLGEVLHPSVSCDGCSEGIRGFRYKCIHCSDYDLCAKCEMKQHHKEHFMVRIPEPIFWKPEFGHRLGHLMAKSARKHRGPCGEGRGRGNAHFHHPCQYNAHDHGQRYQIPQLFHQMFRNMWVPSETQPGQQDEAAATSGEEKKTDHQEDGHVAYLKTIGETVASLLDPLGIDVNIEVETKKDKNAKSKETKSGDSDDQKVEEDNANAKKEDEKISEQSVQNTPSCSPKLDTPVATAEANIAGSEERIVSKVKADHSDNDEWTVINEDSLPSEEKPEGHKEKDSSNGTGSKPTSQNSGTLPKSLNAGKETTNYPSAHTVSNQEFVRAEPRMPDPMHQPVHHRLPVHAPVYPDLNMAVNYPPYNQLPSFLTPNPHSIGRSRHLPPHINQARNNMLAMGFNDEGEWLTTLLIAVNGDVPKALDILQPVKK